MKYLLLFFVLFLFGCTKIILTYKPISIDKPIKPIYPKVQFENRDGGVFFNLENAKKLAETEVLKNQYIEQMESRIDINNKFASETKTEVKK